MAVTVRSHMRRSPEKPEDPFAPIMEARKREFASKWGILLTDASDQRLLQPMTEPGPDRFTQSAIEEQLRGLAKLATKIWRMM